VRLWDVLRWRGLRKFLQPFYRKMFGYKEGDFPITEDVAGRTIALPFFSNLKEEQIEYVVEKVKNSIEYIVSSIE